MFNLFFCGKTLLSEPIADESRWPPELILLREKFTAKSQLEIAQLQIKHEEEVSFNLIEVADIKSPKIEQINKTNLPYSISLIPTLFLLLL